MRHGKDCTLREYDCCHAIDGGLTEEIGVDGEFVKALGYGYQLQWGLFQLQFGISGF